MAFLKSAKMLREERRKDNAKRKAIAALRRMHKVEHRAPVPAAVFPHGHVVPAKVTETKAVVQYIPPPKPTRAPLAMKYAHQPVFIDTRKLERWCTLGTNRLFKERHVYQANCKGGRLYYEPHGSSVLGIAHLDTVQPHPSFSRRNDIVRAKWLDDRLGAYILCDLLPSLGVKLDILLTENEERGDSTAQYFVPPEGKQYNWLVQFDRAGDDVVVYQYNGDPWKAELTAHAFLPSYGSYSDIRELESLGVHAVNIGCGYYNNHARDAWADLSMARDQVRRFLSFYAANRDVRWPWEPPPRPTYRHWYNEWNDDWDGWGLGGHMGYAGYTRRTSPPVIRSTPIAERGGERRLDTGDFRGIYTDDDEAPAKRVLTDLEDDATIDQLVDSYERKRRTPGDKQAWLLSCDRCGEFEIRSELVRLACKYCGSTDTHISLAHIVDHE